MARNLPRRFLLFLGEGNLANAAERANEVLGEVLPFCAGSYAVIGIAELLVVFVAAYIANVLHNNFLLIKYFYTDDCVFSCFDKKVAGSV